MRSLVIGNVALDETLSVPTLPQAGLSILGRAETRDLGGKGANQAVAMGRAGLATILVAAIGDDARGAAIREALADEPVETRLVTHKGAASDVSIIFTTPDGENAIVTTTESADALTLADAADALGTLGPGDFLVMQGNLSAEATREALAEGKRRGLVTIFNPSPLRTYFPILWPFVDIVVLNAGEAEALTRADRGQALRRLMDAGVRQAVLTLGREGALLADASGETAVPAQEAVALDTTGAGDVFLGIMLASAALRAGAIDARALGHAASAAAIAVSRKGARSSFPTEAELAAILAR